MRLVVSGMVSEAGTLTYQKGTLAVGGLYWFMTGYSIGIAVGSLQLLLTISSDCLRYMLFAFCSWSLVVCALHCWGWLFFITRGCASLFSTWFILLIWRYHRAPMIDLMIKVLIDGGLNYNEGWFITTLWLGLISRGFISGAFRIYLVIGGRLLINSLVASLFQLVYFLILSFNLQTALILLLSIDLLPSFNNWLGSLLIQELSIHIVIIKAVLLLLEGMVISFRCVDTSVNGLTKITAVIALF